MLYADAIDFLCRTSLVTTTSSLRKCQKTQKIDENINVEWENLHIFWTTWGTLMKFSGKMWINIKPQKNKTKKNNASLVFGFGYGAKSKTWKPWKCFFFFLIHFVTLSFCLSSFLSFLNLKLQQLSKFEVKEHFPDFRIFDFGYRVKSKIQKPQKFSFICLCWCMLYFNMALYSSM